MGTDPCLPAGRRENLFNLLDPCSIKLTLALTFVYYIAGYPGEFSRALVELIYITESAASHAPALAGRQCDQFLKKHWMSIDRSHGCGAGNLL